MKTIHWISAGIGALFSSGFLTYLSTIPLTSTITANFGSLPLLLEGLGVVFVGYGVVKDFLISKVDKTAASDEVNDKVA